MNNILLDELPSEWNGYTVNTSFRIGVQICLLQDDVEITAEEKTSTILELLFCNDDYSIREYPTNIDEIKDCIEWFLMGWFHDRNVSDTTQEKKRLMDYDVDQFRIYADFLQIYGIDLNSVDLHWWAFQGLLWNMPHEQSSFLQTLEIRQKKPRKGASQEERRLIELAHKRYDLKQNKKEVVFNSDEKEKIDAFDKFMRKGREEKAKQKQIESDVLAEFSRK